MRLTDEQVQKIKGEALDGHKVMDYTLDEQDNFIADGISRLPAHMVYKDKGLLDLCDTIEVLQQENEQLRAQVGKVEDKGQISDGYHTFNELYYHRMMLFAVICNTYKDTAWKSWKHADGTMYDDYFIVGVTTPKGDYTYHYHKDNWGMFKVREVANAPEWDGHKPEDIDRLLSIIPNADYHNPADVEALTKVKETFRALNNRGELGFDYHQWVDEALKTIDGVIGGGEP